jgi:hypothetical protein
VNDAEGAEEVGVENLLHHIRISRPGQPIAAQVDARVVHKNIEAALMAFDLLCGCMNRILPDHVGLNEVNIVESSLQELPDGLLTSLHAAHAKQHGTALVG